MSAVFFSIGREDVDDLVSLLRELSTGQSSQTGGPSESDAEDQHSLYCPCAMHLNLETPAAAASSRGKPLTTDQLITEVDYKSKPSRDLWEYGCDNSRACAPYLDSLLPDEAPIIGDISKAKMKAAEIWGTYMRRNADVTVESSGTPEELHINTLYNANSEFPLWLASAKPRLGQLYIKEIRAFTKAFKPKSKKLAGMLASGRWVGENEKMNVVSGMHCTIAHRNLIRERFTRRTEMLVAFQRASRDSVRSQQSNGTGRVLVRR
ncbi:hypothetical protein L204_101577 [Cryptococcus depauperatus]